MDANLFAIYSKTGGRRKFDVLQHNRESNFISLWPARRKIGET
jgi:hypothetical protein